MKILYILLVILLTVSCNNTKSEESDAKPSLEPKAEQQAQVSKDLDWLLGQWKRINEEEGLTTLEFWEKENSSVYKGLGFTLQNGDTIKQEKMQITKNENSWVLTVKVPEEQTAVIFSEKDVLDKTFTFVNQDIDFPNVIKYWMKGDTLKAKISNQDFEILFDFVKLDD